MATLVFVRYSSSSQSTVERCDACSLSCSSAQESLMADTVLDRYSSSCQSVVVRCDACSLISSSQAAVTDTDCFSRYSGVLIAVSILSRHKGSCHALSLASLATRIISSWSAAYWREVMRRSTPFESLRLTINHSAMRIFRLPKPVVMRFASKR